jgi:hypothetical protein
MQRFFKFLGYNKEDSKKAGTDAEIKLAVDVTSKGIQYFVFGTIATMFFGGGGLIYTILQNPDDQKNTFIKVVTITSLALIFMTVFLVLIALLAFSIKKHIQQFFETYTSDYKIFEQRLQQYLDENRSLSGESNKRFEDSIFLLNESVKNIEITGTKINGNTKGSIIISKIITHTIISKKSFKHTRFLKIRCISEKEMTSWGGRYHWSGDKVASFKSLSDSIDIKNEKTTNTAVASNYKTFDVVFKKPLSQNDETEFKLEWDLEDKRLTSQKFVGTTIAENTNYLEIILFTPPNQRIKVYKQEALITEIINSEIIPSNEQNRYIWEIKSPQLGHTYSICWDFA